MVRYGIHALDVKNLKVARNIFKELISPDPLQSSQIQEYTTKIDLNLKEDFKVSDRLWTKTNKHLKSLTFHRPESAFNRTTSSFPCNRQHFQVDLTKILPSFSLTLNTAMFFADGLGAIKTSSCMYVLSDLCFNYFFYFTSNKHCY